MESKRQLLVFSGRSNPQFTNAVCDHLGVELGRLEVVQFSDGELSVDIDDNVRGRDVFIIQSTSSPGNDHLMELLITIDALRRASAYRITAVIPFFGYARQDRKTRPRAPITAKLVANLLVVAGASRVLTLDLHAGQIMGFFDVPVDNLTGLPVIFPYIKQHYGDQELAVVSPGVGGVERARSLATRLDVPIAIIDKRRARPNQIAEMRVVGDVSGKVCIILDDMIDTGGTICKAVETLRAEGATKVLAACTHPAFSGEALQRLQGAGLEEVICTDSIPVPESKRFPGLTVLTVAPLLAEGIRRIHNEDSISSLLR